MQKKLLSSLKKIILTVNIKNLPAKHLYEKFGFKEEGQINNKDLLKQEIVDQILMSIDVN